jgi:hypothetical protein
VLVCGAVLGAMYAGVHIYLKSAGTRTRAGLGAAVVHEGHLRFAAPLAALGRLRELVRSPQRKICFYLVSHTTCHTTLRTIREH